MSVTKRILVFILVSIGLYLLTILVLSKVRVSTYPIIYGLVDGLNLKGGNSFQKFKEFDTQAHFDVVVVGSSHAYRGYDPRIFEQAGLRMFNLGSSSQTPYNSYFIVNELLHKENCGLLLIDVFHVAFQMDGLESTSDLVANLNDNRAAFCMAVSMKDPRALNMYTVRMINGREAPFYTDTAYVGMGFSENKGLARQSTSYPADGQFKPLPRQLEYFKRTLGLCKERGLDVVLVDHPLPREVHGTRLAQAKRLMEEIAEEYELEFWDFTRTAGFESETHFYDHTHLNQSGVELFNDSLLRRMRKIGINTVK